MKIILAAFLWPIATRASYLSVFWCFEHHENKNQSTTTKAILSINLTYQNKSQCIFWWFVHGSVLEQTLCTPLRRVSVFFSVPGNCCDPRARADEWWPGKLRTSSPPLSEWGLPHGSFSSGSIRHTAQVPRILSYRLAGSTKHYKV